jgi:hypothetical protein
VIEGQEGVVGVEGVIFVEKCVIGLGMELESCMIEAAGSGMVEVAGGGMIEVVGGGIIEVVGECMIGAQDGVKTEEEYATTGQREVPLAAHNIADLEQQCLLCCTVEVMLVQRALQLLGWCVTVQSSFYLVCWNC